MIKNTTLEDSKHFQFQEIYPPFQASQSAQPKLQSSQIVNKEQDQQFKDIYQSFFLDKESLEQILQQRWLKTTEIFYILNNIQRLVSIGFKIQYESHKEKPQSGSFFIFPSEKKDLWRKDFHQYISRKGQASAREDKTKLKINGQVCIECSYSIGAGFQKTSNLPMIQSSQYNTPESFKRRAYTLVDNPQFIVVHYLDEAIKYATLLTNQTNYSYTLQQQQQHSQQINVEEEQNNVEIDSISHHSSLPSLTQASLLPITLTSKATPSIFEDPASSSYQNIQIQNDFEDFLYENQENELDLNFNSFNLSQSNQFLNSTEEMYSQNANIQNNHQSPSNLICNQSSLLQQNYQYQKYHQQSQQNNKVLQTYPNMKGQSVSTSITPQHLTEQHYPSQQQNNSSTTTNPIYNPQSVQQNQFFFTNQDEILSLKSQISGLELKLSNFENQIIQRPLSYPLPPPPPPPPETSHAQQSLKQKQIYPCNSSYNKISMTYQPQYLENSNNNFGQVNGKQINKQSSSNILNLYQMNIEIVDFSPEWDYTTGGQKVLICIRPGLENVTQENESKFECSFGETIVPIKFIQPGVFKCNAPPHDAGFVQINLLYEGNIVSLKHLQDKQLNQFEYRQQIPKNMKKKRARLQQPSDQLLNNDDSREFKVRIVEKLTMLEQRLNNPNFKNNSNKDSTNEQNNNQSDNQQKEGDLSETIDLSSLKMLDNEVLETLNREFFGRLLIKIINRLKSEVSKAERIELLNQLDNYGNGLLHYIVALNYYELIPILFEAGADINLMTKTAGLSALVIAAGKGYEKSVKKLIRLGAILWSRDNNSFNNQQRNQQGRDQINGNPDVDENDFQNNYSDYSVEEDEEDDDDDDELDKGDQKDLELNHNGKSKSIRSGSSKDKPQKRNENKDIALEVALQNNHHGIVEMILRDMTLKNAVMNEENEKDVNQKSQSKRQSFSIDELIFKRNSDHRGNALVDKTETSREGKSRQEENDSTRLVIKRKDEFKGFSKKDSVEDPKFHLLSVNFGINYEEISKVQKIQRNVRAWLIRRQNQDIKHATKLLHSELSNKMDKKRKPIDEKRAAILIQRTVRQWLKINDDNH